MKQEGKIVLAKPKEGTRTTPFIRGVKHYMLERDIEGPTALNNHLLEVGAIDRDRYPIIRSILKGATKPEPWFLMVIKNGLSLNDEETKDLMEEYFQSYGVEE